MTLGAIAAVRVFVSDLDRARGFYQGTLGLPLRSEAGEALVFDAGNCILIVEHCDAEEDKAHRLVGRFTGISFGVPDIAAAHRRLSEQQVPFDGPPITQDWGGQLAHFSDPDGNILTLVQSA